MTNDIIEHKSILAKIQLQSSLGLSTWYEVICWEDNIWKRFDSNEKYFTNGEQVVDWKYCDECLNIKEAIKTYYIEYNNTPTIASLSREYLGL